MAASRMRPATAFAWMPRAWMPLLASLLLAACAASPARPPAPVFVVVRHAEKTADAGDPALSAAGERRAAALARRLRDEPLVAVYATPLRRTRQTAQPAAQAHGLAIAAYEADLPARELAARLRSAHASGTVLVVGHSNTVPGIVAALCGCAVAPLDESEYGDLYRVRGSGAQPELLRERF